MSVVPGAIAFASLPIQYRLQSAVQGARKAVRVSIRDHNDLEDWVSDDGRLVLIGEAAHPFPVRLQFRPTV